MLAASCIVCGGSGRLTDAVGREEFCAACPRPRPPPAADATSLAHIIQGLARNHAELDAHQRSCTEHFCDRCERFRCVNCKQAVAVPGKKPRWCDGCRDAAAYARLMAPTRDSIPPRFRWVIDATVESVIEAVEASPELVRRGLTNPPTTNLIFTGQTTKGKTTLTAAMLDAWVRQDPEHRTGALFVRAPWIARERARNRFGREPEIIEAIIAAPLVNLDDLGNEADDRDGVLRDIVYERYDAGLPTWVNTVLGPNALTLEQLADDLAKKYDGGLISRLLRGKHVVIGRPPLRAVKP